MIKICIIIIALLASTIALSQDKTKYTVRTIVKERIITGYLICEVVDNKVVNTTRINCYKKLKDTYSFKIFKARIETEDIPRDKLYSCEYLKTGIKE